MPVNVSFIYGHIGAFKINDRSNKKILQVEVNRNSILKGKYEKKVPKLSAFQATNLVL